MFFENCEIYSPPSSTASTASIRKGAVFPTNSYITLPNGGPTKSHTNMHTFGKDIWLLADSMQALRIKLNIFTLKVFASIL